MAATSSQPRDAATVERILHSMGVEHYEPGVLHQLLAFMHAHCADIFADGAVYAAHAGRQAVECEDVRLVCRLKSAEANVTSAPFLEWLARERNRQPIPPAPSTTSGIQLPVQKHCLLSVNYDMVARPTEQPAEHEEGRGKREAPSGAEPPARPKGSSAAQKIPIVLHPGGNPPQHAMDAGELGVALAMAPAEELVDPDAAMADALNDDELWE
eukprot:scaffold68738_cov37-Tisochrysis_lutea.AAC.3